MSAARWRACIQSAADFAAAWLMVAASETAAAAMSVAVLAASLRA
jgi:hypothetical protein